MTLATEEDPVAAVNDLLDGTSSGDWSNAGAVPTYIEKTEETERRVKENRTGDAVYLEATLETDHTKLAAGGNEADEIAVVTMQAWTTTSAAQAQNLKRDLISITADKTNDSNSSTAWVDWWPQASEDFRGQKNARTGDHYVESVQVRLRDLRSV